MKFCFYQSIINNLNCILTFSTYILKLTTIQLILIIRINMSSSLYLRKHLIRQISKFGSQNYSKLLQQKINQQPKLDQQLFRETISSLKHTAAYHGIISLSAPQIFYKNRIFVILKKSLINYGQWNNYQHVFLNKKPQDCYDTIINPQLIGYSNFKIKGDQQCSSIQGLKFKVWVPLVNKMKFSKYIQPAQRSKNRNISTFVNCQQSFTGFYGRVFDHQYRHLEGILANVSQICNNEVYLNDDSKQNPQNFDFLRNYRWERQILSSQNVDKQLDKQMKRMKQQKQQQVNKIMGQKIQRIKYDDLPDKIDDKLRQKLVKKYKQAKGSQFGGNISNKTRSVLNITREQNKQNRKQRNQKNEQKRNKVKR